MKSKHLWCDTKRVAKQLGISNARLLKLLRYHNVYRRDSNGQKRLHPSASDIARLRERSWHHKDSNDPQWYSVIQLNQQGVQVARDLLAADRQRQEQETKVAQK